MRSTYRKGCGLKECTEAVEAGAKHEVNEAVVGGYVANGEAHFSAQAELQRAAQLHRGREVGARIQALLALLWAVGQPAHARDCASPRGPTRGFLIGVRSCQERKGVPGVRFCSGMVTEPENLPRPSWRWPPRLCTATHTGRQRRRATASGRAGRVRTNDDQRRRRGAIGDHRKLKGFVKGWVERLAAHRGLEALLLHGDLRTHTRKC